MKSRLPSPDAVIQERNEALFSLDEQKIRVYCKKYDVVIPKNPIVFWGAIYKAILAISDAPNQTQEKAKLWLKQHNMTERIVDTNTGG